MKPGSLGIAGVGLIGSSIGLRAAELGWRVAGFDPAAAHLELAERLGAISSRAASLRALANDVDVLILAAPLDATLAQLAELAAAPPPARLILDVASVKVPVAHAGRTLGAFVPTHPIAGSEQSGPGAARAGLFTNRTWTYDETAPPAVRHEAAAFIASFGAQPLAIGNAEHDRIVALTSHLPQLVAVALGTQLGPRLSDPNVLPLCGSGIRSMLRLGSSAWSMWRAILATNALPVAQEVRRLTAILSGIAETLEAQRPGDLASGFEAAAATVARLGESDVLAAARSPLDSDER